MNNSRTPVSEYAIAIPVIPVGTFNFFFLSRLPDGTYKFTFKWYLNRWNVEVIDPNGGARFATVYPNVIAWGEYVDHSLVFRTDKTAIGQNNLSDASMYMVYWT